MVSMQYILKMEVDSHLFNQLGECTCMNFRVYIFTGECEKGKPRNIIGSFLLWNDIVIAVGHQRKSSHFY